MDYLCELWKVMDCCSELVIRELNSIGQIWFGHLGSVQYVK